MNKYLRKNKKQKGFTLTEVLLVLGIGAMILISVFLVYPKVSAKLRADQETHNVNLIIAGVKVLYSSTPYYTGLSTSVAVSGNVFPDNTLAGSSTTPTNSWKGAYSLTPGNDGPSGVSNSSFTLTDPNIPTEECVNIVTELHSDFYKVKVGDTLVKGSDNSYDPANVVTACNGSKNSNTIQFISF